MYNLTETLQNIEVLELDLEIIEIENPEEPPFEDGYMEIADE